MTAAGAGPLQRMAERSFERRIVRRARFEYLLYLPPGVDDVAERWPLLLFLHGSGERGTELRHVADHGLPRTIEAGARLPFVVAAPQCSADTTWSEHLPELDALVSELLDTLPIDHERVTVTGLSMGGAGAWHLAAMTPGRFAAAVPVCGDRTWFSGGAPPVAGLRDVAVWAFHGGDDQVVPVSVTERTVGALRATGASPRLTIYPGVGHNCWDRAYAEPELVPWLLDQRRRTPPDRAAPVEPVEVVREFWRLMATNAFDSVAAVLAPEFVLEWPQSNERIVGAERFARMNQEYPAHGRWRFELVRVVGDEARVVTDVMVADGVVEARAVSFFTIADGKIVRLVEYWPDSYEPPGWRRHLVEPLVGATGGSGGDA